MALKEKLMDDLKEAMKNKEQVKKSVVTLIRSAIKQKEVDERIELSDDDILAVISKQVKQRKDALEDFKKGGREDLIAQTEEEIAILSSYLPPQLSDEELEGIIKEVIEKVGASSMKDMGKIIGMANPVVKGRADGKRMNEIVKRILA
ncbi:MAG: GatB/YqeY domain-containing protein [Peptostreptococcaceae bacterium]|nr:GatB/YqeY domain-containing protein [Peptostreptococcaceae bacterium]